MKKLQPLVALILIFSFTSSSIYGQDPSYQYYSDYHYSDYPNGETYSSAYMESSHTAHWSVYIPIALIVGAAIWFGLADRKHEKHDSYDSQDGLGSIRDPKRRSTYSCSPSRNLPQRSQGSHSH